MNMRLIIALFVITTFPSTIFALPSSVFTDISAGGRHVLALKSNGEVWAWGANDEEQLGQPSEQKNSASPIKVPLPEGRKAIRISGGDRHSIILLDDHTVLSFGANSEGQLGREGNGISVIHDLKEVTAIAAGGRHSLALKHDGSVWAFGSNLCGQLGDGTTTQRAAPVKVQRLNDIKQNPVIAIAAGLESSYALKKDGSVFAWGTNTRGQLGNGGGENQPFPVRIPNLHDITAIAAGWNHAVALKKDQTVWVWGKLKEEQSEQLPLTSEPQQIEGISDAIHIAAGSEHTVILRSNGSLWTFGLNNKGQLGIEKASPGSIITSPQPSVLKSDVEKITAGIDTTFALKRDGTLSAFGSFQAGQMGDGSLNHPTPVQVYEERSASKVTCGATHSVLLRQDGSAGWIGFYDIQKPSVDEQNSYHPSYQLKTLSSLGPIKQIASGDQHTLVLKSNGEIWAYGRGEKGQLGDNKNANSLAPVKVSEITGAKAIAAGGNSSLAILNDDSLVTWGENSSGQLGDGTTVNQAKPVAVHGLAKITSAAMGKNHAIAHNENGAVWIWGNNHKQQIDPSDKDLILTPKQVPNLKAKAVAAGEGFSLALLNDHNNSVIAWGVNYLGQLGLGDTALRSVPTPIPNLTNIEQIAAGTSHAIARLTNGTLKAWGLNHLGQLGDGTLIDRTSPIAAKDLTGITDIAAGAYHSIAVRNDHTAWSWGNNAQEQLGVSATREHRSAIRLIPDSEDTDADGMPDPLERRYFGDLSHNGTADTDGDGWTDIQEILFGTDPILTDTDNDNLTDIADASNHAHLNQARLSTEPHPIENQTHQQPSGAQNNAASSPEVSSRDVKGLILISATRPTATSAKADTTNNVDNRLPEHDANAQLGITIVYPENGEIL